MRKETNDGHSRRWSLHVCPGAEEKLEFSDMPHRVHVNTPWVHVAFALNRNSMFAGRMREHVCWKYMPLIAMSGMSSFTEEQRLEMRKYAQDLAARKGSHYPASWWMIIRNR